MSKILLTLLAFSLLFSGDSSKEKCSCRPDIPADGKGDGTCSVTQDGAKWCEIRFSGTAQVPANFSGDLAMLHQPDKRDFALKRLGSVQPEGWNLEYVRGFVPAMLEDSLRERAPQRLREISESVELAAPDLLPILQKESSLAKEINLGKDSKYKAIVSYGCLDFTQGTFAAMVKSQFSEAPNRCQWK
jgi:hypothetical protein